MQRGMDMKHETLIDATLISAPCTTKNKTEERGPRMHQIKKQRGITTLRTKAYGMKCL